MKFLISMCFLIVKNIESFRIFPKQIDFPEDEIQFPGITITEGILRI
jgi:hypothetical protein